jgi:hypothetical protein
VDPGSSSDGSGTHDPAADSSIMGEPAAPPDPAGDSSIMGENPKPKDPVVDPSATDPAPDLSTGGDLDKVLPYEDYQTRGKNALEKLN